MKSSRDAQDLAVFKENSLRISRKPLLYHIHPILGHNFPNSRQLTTLPCPMIHRGIFLSLESASFQKTYTFPTNPTLPSIHKHFQLVGKCSLVSLKVCKLFLSHKKHFGKFHTKSFYHLTIYLQFRNNMYKSTTALSITLQPFLRKFPIAL